MNRPPNYSFKKQDTAEVIQLAIPCWPGWEFGLDTACVALGY